MEVDSRTAATDLGAEWRNLAEELGGGGVAIARLGADDAPPHLPHPDGRPANRPPGGEVGYPWWMAVAPGAAARSDAGRRASGVDSAVRLPIGRRWAHPGAPPEDPGSSVIVRPTRPEDPGSSGLPDRTHAARVECRACRPPIRLPISGIPRTSLPHRKIHGFPLAWRRPSLARCRGVQPLSTGPPLHDSRSRITEEWEAWSGVQSGSH